MFASITTFVVCRLVSGWAGATFAILDSFGITLWFAVCGRAYLRFVWFGARCWELGAQIDTLIFRHPPFPFLP